MKVLRQLGCSPNLNNITSYRRSKEFSVKNFNSKNHWNLWATFILAALLPHQFLLSIVWFKFIVCFHSLFIFSSPSFSLSFLSNYKTGSFLHWLRTLKKISTSFSIFGLEEGKSTRNNILGRKLKSVVHVHLYFCLGYFQWRCMRHYKEQTERWCNKNSVDLFLFWESICFLSMKAEYLAFAVTLNTGKSSSLSCTK